MGAGKSAVGRGLSEASGRPFIDTDILLQNRFGRPVSQVFQIYGEETFRSHETSVLRTLEPSNSVLATGGGIVLRDENWAELRRLGTSIFLSASPDTLIERLEASKKRRPLLETEDWQEKAKDILEKRMPIYRKADIIVEVDNLPIESAVGRVLEAIRTFESNRDQA